MLNVILDKISRCIAYSMYIYGPIHYIIIHICSKVID